MGMGSGNIRHQLGGGKGNRKWADAMTSQMSGLAYSTAQYPPLTSSTSIRVTSQSLTFEAPTGFLEDVTSDSQPKRTKNTQLIMGVPILAIPESLVLSTRHEPPLAHSAIIVHGTHR
jgi:hypothetical protein